MSKTVNIDRHHLQRGWHRAWLTHEVPMSKGCHEVASKWLISYAVETGDIFQDPMYLIG